MSTKDFLKFYNEDDFYSNEFFFGYYLVYGNKHILYLYICIIYINKIYVSNIR